MQRLHSVGVHQALYGTSLFRRFACQASGPLETIGCDVMPSRRHETGEMSASQRETPTISVACWLATNRSSQREALLHAASSRDGLVCSDAVRRYDHRRLDTYPFDKLRAGSYEPTTNRENNALSLILLYRHVRFLTREKYKKFNIFLTFFILRKADDHGGGRPYKGLFHDEYRTPSIESKIPRHVFSPNSNEN